MYDIAKKLMDFSGKRNWDQLAEVNTNEDLLKIIANFEEDLEGA